jgi:hypothetical protein
VKPLRFATQSREALAALGFKDDVAAIDVWLRQRGRQ